MSTTALQDAAAEAVAATSPAGAVDSTTGAKEKKRRELPKVTVPAILTRPGTLAYVLLSLFALLMLAMIAGLMTSSITPAQVSTCFWAMVTVAVLAGGTIIWGQASGALE